MYEFSGANIEEKEILFLDPETNESYHIPLYMAERVETASVSVSHISTYPPRQLMGDWTRSDHEVVSSYTQSDFTGGGQIWDADEGSDLNRFWFGSLGTRHPGQMTLPLKSYYHEDPEDANLAIPLGDYGIDFYAAFGNKLVTATDVSHTEVAELEHVPVAKPSVVFTGTSNDPKLFIAMGPHGYQSWDGLNLSQLDTDVKPIQFLEWDEKLYALQGNGEVYESLTGHGDWDLKFRVPPQAEPRGLVEFYDAQDTPIPYVVCRNGVYAIDMSIGKAYKTKLDPPPHGDAGLAAATWREDLYVSYGIGVHQYTNNSIVAMGLDRDDGVPQWMDGRIASMASGYNGMYALVQGVQLPTAYLEPSFITDLSWHDFYMSPSRSQPVLMMWDGNGWHAVWVPEDATRQPTSLVISTQSGRERLWWGVGNRLYWQDVHHMYYNPKQRQPDATYEKSGWIETSIYDYSMKGQEKILHQIEAMASNCSPTERIIIEYKRDEGNWVQLPQITSDTFTHKHLFKIGPKGMFPDNVTPRFDGEPFVNLRIRIRMERDPDDSSKTPILESFSSVFHKLMSPFKAFSAVIGIPHSHSNREYKGRTQVELIRFVDRMVTAKTMVPMCYGGQWRSVRFAGANGEDHDGVDLSGTRTISVLEVL